MALELDDNDVGMAAPSATKGLFDIGEEEMSDQDVLDILRSNEKKNFVKRILYPEKSLVLDIGDNGEGTIATHKMSYSTIDNGNAVVYPTVVQQGEELVELDPRKAYDYAIKSGEFIVMPEKKAELFTKNYKKAWSIGDENSDSAILARLVETEAPKPRDDSLIGFIPSGNEINYDEETARQLPGNDPQRAREIAAAINRTNAKPSDEPSTFDVAASSVAKSGAKLFGDYPAALYHLMFGSGKEIATQPELETVVSEAQKTPDDLRSRMILESNARQSDVSANEAAKEAASVAIEGPRADTAVSKYVYRIMNENKPAEININSADSENNVFASEKNFTKWYGDKMREIKRRADETLSKAGELTLDNGLFTKKNLDALPKVIASQMGFVLESTLLSILAGGPLEGFAKAGDIVKNSKLGLHVAKMAVGGSKGAAALNKLLPYAADSLVGAVPSAINETHDIALEAYNAVKKRGGTEEESNAAYYDSFGKAFAATLGTEALQYYINFKSMNKLKPIKSPVGADSDTMDKLAKSVFKSAANMASAAARNFLPQLGQEVMQDYSVADYTKTNVLDPKYLINTMAGVMGQSGAVAAVTAPIRMSGPQVADTSTTSQLERNYVYDSAKRTYESVLKDKEELDKLTQEEDSLRGLRGAPDQGIVPGIAPSIDEAARNEKGELVNNNVSRLEQIKSRKNDLVRNIADNSEFADRFAPWADNESATDEATFGKFASEVYGEDALEPMLRSVRTDNGKLILTINEAIKKRENITNAIKESEKLYSSTLSQLSDESKNAIIKDARAAYDSITKEIEQTENEEDKRQLIQVQDELRYALAGTYNEETNSFDVNTTHLLKILMDMSENGDDYISSLKNMEDVAKVLESVTASDAIVSSMLKKEDRAVLRDAAIKAANESEDSDMKRLIMNAVQREDYSTLVHLLGANTGVNSAVMGRIEAGDEAVSLITNPDGTQSYVKQVGTDEKGNPLYSKASPVDSSVVASSAGIRAGDRVSVEGEKDRTYVFSGIENGMATLLEVDNKGRVSEQPKLSVPVARLRKSDMRIPIKGVDAATGNTVITEDVRGADSEGNITTSKGDVIVSPKPVVPDRTVGNPYKYYGSEVAFSGEQSDAPIEPEQNVEAKQEEKSENAAENNDIIRAGDSVTYQWDGKEYYFDGVTAASGNAVIREVGDDGRPTGKGILVPMSSISKRAVEPVRETAAMPPAVPVAAPEPVQAPSNASSENIPETEASARATGREGKKYDDDIEELRDIMLETRNPIKMEALLVMADNIGSIRSPRTSREDIESKVISDLSKRTGRDKDSTVIADAAAWAMDLYDSFQNRPERGLSLTSDIINKVYDATAKEYAGQGYAGNKFKYDMKLLLGLMPNRMMSKVNSIVLPFMGSGASGIIAQKRLWSNGNRNVSVFASDLNPAIVKAMNAMKDNPAAVQVEINGIMHKMSIILTKFYENEYTAEEDNMDHEARIKRVTAREAAFVALSQLWNKYNDSGNKLSAAEEAAWFVIANDGSIGMNGGGWGNTSGSVTGKDVHVGEPRYPRAQKLLVTDDAQQNTGSSHFIPQRISDGIIIRDTSSKSRNPAIVRKSINALAVTMRNRVNNTSEAIRDWTIVHESAEDTLARVGKSGKNGLPEHSLIMLDPPYVPTETQEASGGTSLRYSGAEDTGIMSNEGAAEFINKTVAPLAKNNYVIIHNNASPRLIELAKQSGLDYRIVNNVGRTTWKGKEGEKSGVSGNRNEVVFYNTLSKLPGDENKKYTGKVKQSDTNYEERRNNSIAQQERIDNAYGSMNAMLSVDGGKSSEELRSYMSDDLFMDDIVDPELTDEQRAIVDFVESNGARVQFFDGPSELNGFIRSNPVTHNSTIFININKEARGFEFTIWHEFTHFLQSSHPQSYRELCRALGITDEQFDAFDKNIGEFYGNRYTQLNEVVANAMADTKILNKLSKALQRKPSLLNRIIRAAREFFVSMRNFMTGRRRDVVESSTKESNTTKYLTNDQITEMQGWLISALNHGRPKGSPAVFIGKSGEAHTIDTASVDQSGRSSIAERLRRNRGMSDTVVAESGKEKEADNANAQEAPKDESAAKLSKSLGEKISYDTRRKNEFPGVRRASERAYEMMIDELYFLGKTQDQFDKAYASVYGNPPPSAFNAYGKARLVPAEQANAIKDINTLFDILHDVTPEDNDKLLPFLVAQHGIEYYTQLNVDPGLGMTLEELQAIVKNTDKRISDIAGDLRDRYNEIQRNMLVGSGIMSQEKFDEMRKMYPFYVPFLRSGSAGEMSDYISGRLHKHSVTVKDPVRSIVLKGKDNREHRVFNPIQTMIRNIAIFHSAKARNDVSKAVLSMASMEGFESLAVERERGDRDTVTFSVWDNGKRTMYKTDPDIFRALDNLSKTFDTTIIEDIAESINDFFKTMTTRWNPKFGLSNLFRDSFQVALVSKDPLAMPFYNTLIGMSYQIIAKRAAKALEKGEDISDRRKRILAIVTEAFDSGLAYSTMAEAMDNASPENIAKQYKKDRRISMSNAGAFGLLSPLFWAKRKGRAALEKVGRINEMVEIAPKIHEYAYLRNKGVDSMRATITAREVNIDFQRHGYKAKSWNRFVPFLSASLQGVDRVVRAAGASELSKGNYKNAAKDFAIFMLRGFLFITLPSVLIWMYNKDDDDYGDKLRDRKDASWLIPVDVDDSGHSVYLALPKPRELGIMFGSSVERLLNHVYEKDADAFKDLEANFFESITPSVFPQIVRPMVESYFDHWFFTGRSIIPESKKALPYHMQYSAKTSSLARAVAAGLHNVGIDKALGRFASPYIIDHLIREYTGTLGKDILSTTDYAINMLGANAPMEKSSMVERPFWRTFFITRSSGSQAVNDFYDTYDDVERLKNGDPERGNKRMFSKFAKARKDLSEMWGDANDVRQDMNMSPEAKRRKLDAIDDMARRKAMSVMREYRRFAERQAAQKD